MLGHGENSIFETVLELRDSFPALRLSPVIADVKDPERIPAILGEHGVHVVFHAAAHKHVPLMQTNVAEAVAEQCPRNEERRRGCAEQQRRAAGAAFHG